MFHCLTPCAHLMLAGSMPHDIMLDVEWETAANAIDQWLEATSHDVMSNLSHRESQLRHLKHTPPPSPQSPGFPGADR
eukprot:1186037-Prorocentrum_minimum.AAC.1